MSYRLHVSRRAARQIRAASTWWVQNREKARSAFADDLEDALSLVGDLPMLGEPVNHPRIPDARRMLLNRTRYYMYYSVHDDAGIVEVLALWHTSRGGQPRL